MSALGRTLYSSLFSLAVVASLITAPSLLAQPYEEIAKLVASDAGSGDNLGCDVAIEGARIVVGAHDHFGPGGPNSGAVYIYERLAGGEWVEVAELNPEDSRPSDIFGLDVAMSGDTVVGGSILDNNQSGSVSVFQRDWGGLGNWGEVKKLFEPDGPGIVFGGALAISGETLLVATRTTTIRVRSRERSMSLRAMPEAPTIGVRCRS